MKPSVRLYGHQLGFSSFSQVTRGFAKALDDRGLFGGFVPVDFFDDEAVYPGTSCPVAVNTGMPSAIGQALRLGNHRERYLMLAPNSDRIPKKMTEWLPDLATGLLSPSHWGCQVLRSQVPKLPVHYVPHGVHEEYRRDARARRECVEWFERSGQFNVLHMTSTNSERKGTKLLLEAWKAFTDSKTQLTVVVRYEGYVELVTLTANLGLADSVSVVASDGSPYADVAALYGTHNVLCQPSRAEGFGLCPLEAKACGVPVVMTNCTGHTEHARVGAHVIIETEADEPIDDMEGARAPGLQVEAIVEALRRAKKTYPALEDVASATADNVRQQFSWPNTTGKAMEVLVK